MSRCPRRVAVLVAVAGCWVLLSDLAPTAGTLALIRQVLASPATVLDAQGPEAVLLALVSALAWLALGWLALVLPLVAAAGLPGRVGALAGAATRRVAPAAAVRVLATALGLSLLGGLGAAPALAAPAPQTVAVSQLNLDWPASSAPIVTSHPAAGRKQRAPSREAPSAEVVVRRGDSLWTVAARHLGPDATQIEIAREWPRWWAANRTVVGDNPDVIRPGQRLRPPQPAAQTNGRTP